MRALKAILTAISAALLTCACAGPGMVAHAAVQGSGEAWTDGVALVAIGQLDGGFVVFGKATGIEITFPIQVQEGEVLVVNHTTGETLHLQVGEPLPAYTKSLFREYEIKELGLTFQEEGLQ